MSVGLPTKLLYQTKIEAASARSYRSNIQPQNGTGNYSAGDTIIINIPTRNNSVLVPSESYLKFNVSLTNGATINNFVRLESGGAHGFIQRIRVFSGSNLLSDIDDYHLLAKIMMDIQVSSDATYGKLSIMSGTRSDLTAVTNQTNSISSVYQTNSGQRFNDTTDALGNVTYAAIAANATIPSKTFSINLMSLVGTLCSEKYIPLFACTSAPLRIEIVLVSSSNLPLCTNQLLATTTPLTISNCEYVAQMIESSDSAMTTILAQTNGKPLQFVVTDFKNLSSSANGATSTTGSTTFSIPIAAKYSSLKSLFVFMRDSGKTNSLTYFPQSANKFNLRNIFLELDLKPYLVKILITYLHFLVSC